MNGSATKWSVVVSFSASTVPSAMQLRFAFTSFTVALIRPWPNSTRPSSFTEPGLGSGRFTSHLLSLAESRPNISTASPVKWYFSLYVA